MGRIAFGFRIVCGPLPKPRIEIWAFGVQVIETGNHS